MTVTAVERSTGSSNGITITNDENRLTKEEMEHMIADAERYRLDDLEQKKRALARCELDTYCRDLKSSLSKRGIKHPMKKTLIEKCQQTIQWLENGPFATSEEMVAKKESIIHLRNVIFPV